MDLMSVLLIMQKLKKFYLRGNENVSERGKLDQEQMASDDGMDVHDCMFV